MNREDGPELPACEALRGEARFKTYTLWAGKSVLFSATKLVLICFPGPENEHFACYGLESLRIRF